MNRFETEEQFGNVSSKFKLVCQIGGENYEVNLVVLL